MTARLIMFDCDGTLVDSQHMIVSAMTAAFAGQGLEPPVRQAILHTVGRSLIETMQDLLPGADAALHAALAGDYRRAFHGLRASGGYLEPMFEGARETLIALAAMPGIQLGLATGKSRRGVDTLLAREELTGLFQTIQTADDAPSKPHPAMLLQALSETGIHATEAVMIGDTVHDIAMAVNARIPAIGVSWGYHSAMHLQQQGAAAIAHDFPGLLSELEHIAGNDAA